MITLPVQADRQASSAHLLSRERFVRGEPRAPLEIQTWGFGDPVRRFESGRTQPPTVAESVTKSIRGAPAVNDRSGRSVGAACVWKSEMNVNSLSRYWVLSRFVAMR